MNLKKETRSLNMKKFGDLDTSWTNFGWMPKDSDFYTKVINVF